MHERKKKDCTVALREQHKQAALPQDLGIDLKTVNTATGHLHSFRLCYFSLLPSNIQKYVIFELSQIMGLDACHIYTGVSKQKTCNINPLPHVNLLNCTTELCRGEKSPGTSQTSRSVIYALPSQSSQLLHDNKSWSCDHLFP